MTGASGRLGRSLANRLGHGALFDATLLANPRGDGCRGGLPTLDVTDASAVQAAFDFYRPQVVIHLASLHGGAAERDPARTDAVNVLAVRTIADAAARFGVSRVVFTSSAAVYGDSHTRPIHETAATEGKSRYALSKLAGEQILRSQSRLTGVETVLLRIFNVFGPGFDDSLVFRLLSSTPASPVRLHALDEFVRDYVHAEDVVDAVLDSVFAPLPRDSVTINIGTGVPISNRALVQRLSGRRPVHFVIDDCGGPSYSCADISRARELLAFSPKHLP